MSIVEEAAKIIDPVAFTDVAWANGSIELDQDDLEMVRRRYCRSIAMNKATQVLRLALAAGSSLRGQLIEDELSGWETLGIKGIRESEALRKIVEAKFD